MAMPTRLWAVTSAARSGLSISAVPGDSTARHFAIGAFWALVGAVVSRGLTLASSVVAGRLLGPTGFGEIGMIQSTQGLFGIVAGAGLGLAATKFVAEFRSTDPTKSGRCATLATTIALVSGTVMALVLLALSGVMASSVLRAPHLTVELRVATGLVLFGTINGVQTGALVGFGDFRTLAVLSSIRGVCLCGFLIAGIAVGGVLGGVVGLVLTEAIAVLANHVALRRILPAPVAGRDRRAAWSELMLMSRFSGLSLLGSIGTMSAMWFANLVLVAQPGGYAALGVFNAAERWRQLLLFLPASFSPVILTTLSNLHGRKDPDAYRRLFGLNLAVSIAVVVVPSIGIMLCAGPAMGLFGDEYRGGWMTLVILSASAVVVVLNNLLGQILVSRGAVMGRFVLDVLLAAVLALASWQLIPIYREQGMALGSLIAFAVTAAALAATAIHFMRAHRSER
ncbi:MAG TPA: oligosaccharide flippase family protein [Candidatus Dormibacteraeota bacterium]|nr:oligosaccharide flippase family protein [Candidatus Dormibacteraeota bacterium]